MLGVCYCLVEKHGDPAQLVCQADTVRISNVETKQQPVSVYHTNHML